MTAVRLHLARLPDAAAPSFDAQARALRAPLMPAAPVWQVASLDEAWRLAQFVDLVEAGYGARDAIWRSVRQALGRFVRAHWQDSACRALCGRSACLADMAEALLDEAASA
jgi:hypothetical protein